MCVYVRDMLRGFCVGRRVHCVCVFFSRRELLASVAALFVFIVWCDGVALNRAKQLTALLFLRV